MSSIPATSAAISIGLKGVAHAVLIFAAWGVTLFVSLFVVVLPHHWPWMLIAIPLQTFLNVGLFITAHDAMHCTLAPTAPRLNDAMGRIALWCYAFFDFDSVKWEHFRHHGEPVSDGDPDYHAHERFWPWYVRFMQSYITWRQWLGMPIAFCALWLLIGVRPENLLLFWAAPALLSTLQLFYFGTYLPHRTPHEGHRDEHRATTSGFSNWRSLLTCYHFGRHWEHHAYPSVPWWKLGRFTPPPSPADDAARVEESKEPRVHAPRQ
jgi:beta-carotene/zeaxanthin 4-ketolase